VGKCHHHLIIHNLYLKTTNWKRNWNKCQFICGLVPAVFSVWLDEWDVVRWFNTDCNPFRPFVEAFWVMHLCGCLSVNNYWTFLLHKQFRWRKIIVTKVLFPILISKLYKEKSDFISLIPTIKYSIGVLKWFVPWLNKSFNQQTRHEFNWFPIHYPL